uniref:Pectinesterase catalytic domain-containing protein n=1 Tax=Musa acuminata subsp. malaccensis TaxID=214687 RepID=A0A804J7U7_MUSAM
MRDITIENAAGPSKLQAVALRVGADLSAFYKCSFVGYQDTLYVHSLRQFYRECDPMSNQQNVFTAQGREDPNQNTGISIHKCKVAAAADLIPWNGDFALNTLYYGEYMNRGPGSNTTGRVKWPGYRVINSTAEASNFTVTSFIQGDQWLGSTSVPFTSGLN